MADMTDELQELRKRLASLEQEVYESRGLNRRLAELIDVVAELLLPATFPDEQRLRQALSRLGQPR